MDYQALICALAPYMAELVRMSESEDWDESAAQELVVGLAAIWKAFGPEEEKGPSFSETAEFLA